MWVPFDKGKTSMTGAVGINMSSSTRVSAAEIERFSKLAPKWWDLDGPMRPLHRMNALRVDWIASRMPKHASMLDLGCGGGIATEALVRKNFVMTGADASADAIGVARSHAAAAGLEIDYRVALAEDLVTEGLTYQGISALEIIEHVPDPQEFMNTLAKLLVPGGHLFVSTLNRSLRSLAIAKIGAEYIARLLPAGTHEWRKFIKPDELASLGRIAGLHLTDLSGMTYGLASGTWSASRDVSINYIAAFTRS
jgi:2-polyprenyl-6-hydroxyphenyl methylase/3-demethylubiquinone-9 3-methyltransferase